GGNVYLTTRFPDSDAERAAAMLKAEKTNLASALKLDATRAGGAVVVKVKNTGVGHSFPTGVTDIREPWVEVQAIDANGQVVARFGGPDAANLIPESAARLGMDIAKSDGTVLFLHELSETTRIPFDRRVPANGELELLLAVPSTLP